MQGVPPTCQSKLFFIISIMIFVCLLFLCYSFNLFYYYLCYLVNFFNSINRWKTPTAKTNMRGVLPMRKIKWFIAMLSLFILHYGFCLIIVTLPHCFYFIACINLILFQQHLETENLQPQKRLRKVCCLRAGTNYLLQHYHHFLLFALGRLFLCCFSFIITSFNNVFKKYLVTEHCQPQKRTCDTTNCFCARTNFYRRFIAGY